jgi:hypothetical protein
MTLSNHALDGMREIFGIDFTGAAKPGKKIWIADG